MRLRRIPRASSMLEAHPRWVVSEPGALRGKWHAHFENQHPIHVEIGCGKGQFITEMAIKYPEVNFIAIEKYDSVLIRALEKVCQIEQKNVQLVLLDAVELRSIFSTGEVQKIYLNFSDPWPKKRQAKRRLTASSYLTLFKDVLQDEGVLHVRTDNFGLFQFSLESINHDPDYWICHMDLDRHRNASDDDVMTEFEEKFVRENKPIYELEAWRKRRK